MEQNKKKFSNEWIEGFVWGMIATTHFVVVIGILVLLSK